MNSPETVNEWDGNGGFKEMITYTMSKLPNYEGSIDDILNNMISILGKDKVCEHCSQMLISFNDIDNPSAIKTLK